MPKAEARGLQATISAMLVLAACSEESPPPEPKPEVRTERPGPAPAPPPAETAAAPAPPASPDRSPAALLRRYHDLIAAKRFPEAYRLREPGGADLAAFAAHFGRYRTYQVTIGTPSQPAEAGEWVYVEVPVQSYGTMADGKPFGSAGTVTLRRRSHGGEWRIYTKR